MEYLKSKPPWEFQDASQLCLLPPPREPGQSCGQIQTQDPNHRAPVLHTFGAWREPTGSPAVGPSAGREPAAGGWCHGAQEANPHSP